MDLEKVLREETVRNIGYRAIVKIAPGATVRDAVRVMKAGRVGSALVCDDEKLVGLFTERDLLKRFTGDPAALEGPISSVMTPNPVTAGLDESVASAIRKMQEGGFRRLPVVDENQRPVGTLSVKRIVKFIADHFPAAVFNIPPRPDQFASQREGA